MNTYEFDAAAYRRIRLPWLLLLLLISLAVDGILYWIWQEGVSPNAQFYWDIGFAFLYIVNLLFVKGVALYKYLHVKKQRTRSYVRLEQNLVVHYVFLSSMPHAKVEWVKETKFASSGKTEYICADTFYIKNVKNLEQSVNGSIRIEGTIECESLREGWEEYSSEFGKPFKKTIQRHTIPGYYAGMDVILHALNTLK